MNLVAALPDGTEMIAWFVYMFHARVVIGGLADPQDVTWFIDNHHKNVIEGCTVQGREIVPK